jgi:serine/threonine protein kinase
MENNRLTKIRGYELQESIGKGGFGAVYRALQPAVGREVAIKVILPSHANPKAGGMRSRSGNPLGFINKSCSSCGCPLGSARVVNQPLSSRLLG